MLNYPRSAEGLDVGVLGLGIGTLAAYGLSLIHISEPTRLLSISYAVFCLKKKTQKGLSTPVYLTLLTMITSS